MAKKIVHCDVYYHFEQVFIAIIILNLPNYFDMDLYRCKTLSTGTWQYTGAFAISLIYFLIEFKLHSREWKIILPAHRAGALPKSPDPSRFYRKFPVFPVKFCTLQGHKNLGHVC